MHQIIFKWTDTKFVSSKSPFTLCLKFQEILEKIEYWMVKYDTDIEKIDLKIQKMKTKHESTVERRYALEEKVSFTQIFYLNYSSSMDSLVKMFNII